MVRRHCQGVGFSEQHMTRQVVDMIEVGNCGRKMIKPRAMVCEYVACLSAGTFRSLILIRAWLESELHRLLDPGNAKPT